MGNAFTIIMLPISGVVLGKFLHNPAFGTQRNSIISENAGRIMTDNQPIKN